MKITAFNFQPLIRKMWESSKIKSFPTNGIQLYRLVFSQSLNYEYKKGHLFWHESVTRMHANIHRFSFNTVHSLISLFGMNFTFNFELASISL